MTILKSTSIYNVMNTIKNLIPIAFMLFYRNRFLTRQFISTHHSLFTIYPWRDKSRKPVRHIFTLFTHCMESINCPFCLPAYLTTDIPSAKTFIFLSIHFPYFINHILVIFNLPSQISCIPIFSRIIQSKIKLHSIFFCQTQIHINQINRWHITSFFQQVFRRVSNKFTISGTNHNYGINSDILHMLKIHIPFSFSPILMRYIMRYFIQKCSRNRKTIFFRNN